MNTHTVKVCGYLHTNGQRFFLLTPYPVARDSWQDNGTYRFVCVPDEVIDYKTDENIPSVTPIYDYARHVVTNSFAIEYKADLSPINIRVLTDIDLTVTQLVEE